MRDIVENSKFADEISSRKTRYIASVDLGTTTIRCFIYTQNVEVVGRAEEKVSLLYPQPGYVEMDPSDLWEKFVNVIKAAIADSGVCPKDIDCLGITTLRATFLTWDRRSGEALHNFIVWKDIRADNLVKEWNNSWTLMGLRFGSSILYNILRQKRYLAASVLKFMNIQVTLRLKWVFENIKRVKDLASQGQVMFGTIDTWLVYKLSGGKVHATDYSNASGTALYDPFIQDWSDIMRGLLSLPKSIYPQLRDSVGEWCTCSPDLFGAPIPITAVVSDQGAALFGACGFRRGDVKITLGTGSFLNVNTGDKAHASISGIYPVHGWKDWEGLIHMAEASSNDNGSVIEWGRKIGLYENASETSDMASSVKSSNNVFFIPAFQGIQAPVNDARATSGFLGLSEDTSRAHMVRAMLESLAFRVYQMYNTVREEADYDLLNLRVDGGVSRNDFMMQMIATLTGKPIERPLCTDSSALGCAFLAGIGAGIWKSRSELLPLSKTERVFKPDMDLQPKLLALMKEWERALQRFTKWQTVP
ncbi:putative glycerol kinase 5 [Halocaridina rubra]|uniref:Glycerol kinase 5 n=1 Tax=Halocaridina rubra TaxID=373956 RepID=A0AAN8WY40_HALRR